MSDIEVRELADSTSFPPTIVDVGTGAKSSVEVDRSVPPSSVEVVGVASRRRFTSDSKCRILDEVSLAGHGEIWLILRREGLYSSRASKWRDWRNGMTSPVCQYQARKKTDEPQESTLFLVIDTSTIT